MKLGIRIIACIAMMAIALTMVVFTVADFREAEANGYILGEHKGNIAVYRRGQEDEPLAVTDIELGSLRQTDREKILSGLSASGERELQELLEDLGS